MTPIRELREKSPVSRVSYGSAWLIAALMFSGCESAPKAGGMKQALDDYNSQRFTQAHEQAIAVQEKATGPEREDAAYLAGLSAYQLGQTDEAERRLMAASKSQNPETAAKAKAMLGQVRMDQRRPRDAAALFAEAAHDLNGEDAKKCAYNASVAYQQAGDIASAKRWLAQSGMKGVGSSAVASTVGAGSSSLASVAADAAGAFTLQVGAFREKSRAQQAAEEAQKLATRDGLGAVRIISKRDERGTPMFIVQVGSFPTRDAATAARAKLGKLQYIVAQTSMKS